VTANDLESDHPLLLFPQEAIYQFGLKNRKNLPHRILFFRDGVSEGEYAKVAEFEFMKIKGIIAPSAFLKRIFLNINFLDAESIDKVWDHLKLPSSVAKPTVTFIIVGKRCDLFFFFSPCRIIITHDRFRHHVRFFPQPR